VNTRGQTDKRMKASAHQYHIESKLANGPGICNDYRTTRGVLPAVVMKISVSLNVILCSTLKTIRTFGKKMTPQYSG
jgi:hypothetical protein